MTPLDDEQRAFLAQSVAGAALQGHADAALEVVEIGARLFFQTCIASDGCAAELVDIIMGELAAAEERQAAEGITPDTARTIDPAVMRAVRAVMDDPSEE